MQQGQIRLQGLQGGDIVANQIVTEQDFSRSQKGIKLVQGLPAVAPAFSGKRLFFQQCSDSIDPPCPVDLQVQAADDRYLITGYITTCFHIP